MLGESTDAVPLTLKSTYHLRLIIGDEAVSRRLAHL